MPKIITAILAILLLSCKNTSNVDVNPFSLLSASESGIDFNNTVSDQEKFNVLSYRNYYNGGGVAIGDINNDGLKDIYFTANMGPNKLYLNKGSMNFEDISSKAGVTGKEAWDTGVTMADVNADGYQDIYVCYSGDAEKQNKENELFINNKNGTFTESAAAYGLNDAGLSTHAAFFDYDLDGDLDCYVLNNSYKDPERISLYSRERFEYDALGGDRLYKNVNGKFINATKESGIFSSNIGFGLGISVGDVNGDLYPDIYISNDFWERDYLYINQKNGTFTEKLTENIGHTSLASMGSDMADINNDGHLDIFSTDMLPPDNYRLKAATKFDDYYLYDLKFNNSYYYQYVQNCLQVNSGDGTFTETAHFSNVAATDWSWGALIFDMNLDGKKDIFVSNGVYHDITDSDFAEFIADKRNIEKVVTDKGRYDFRDFVQYLPHNKRRNYAFINGGNLKFDNLAADLKLDQESFSNGSAYGDLDNDGDFDLVVNNVNMPAFLYQNNAKNSHLKIKLKGGLANPDAIGTLVKAYSSGSCQTAHVANARGFQSSSDTDIIFGFENIKNIDSLMVIWPNGKTQTLANPKLNSTLTLNQKDASVSYKPTTTSTLPVFKPFNGLVAGHIENNYVDYDADRLMPHVLSTEGPKIINGDVNGDGKEDLILLGAKGQADQLLLFNGTDFKASLQPAFSKTTQADRTAGALFDADGDKDLDYLACYGGNEYRGGFDTFKSAYFENNGVGSFTRKPSGLELISGQIGCVKPCDFDRDGDQDLFVGGKAVPGAYGLTPRSYVLRNDGDGVWSDQTNQYTGPLGMVTDAAWSDTNADGWADLVVVGEWMPISIFENQKGILNQKPIEIQNSNGWWNTIYTTDLDQDGDDDFLLGNWGTNIKLKASEDKPLKLTVSDIDDNKRPDVLIEWFGPEDTKPFPFASKQDLTAQLPQLKKTILKYQDFATKQIKDIFETDKLKKGIHKTVYNFNSSMLINSKGSFSLNPLPDQAQLSPIFTFASADFDKDGRKDIYFGGNFYRLKPEMGRHDAHLGGYFKNTKEGLKYINPKQSGLHANGEIRDAKIINNKLIIARNNAGVLTYVYL